MKTSNTHIAIFIKPAGVCYVAENKQYC